MANADNNMHIFQDQAEVADALASLTMKAAEQAIEERGSFTVALAGGSLIKLLGGLKGKNGIDWDNWHVFWVDERCVPHDDPESNYGGALQALLSDVPILSRSCMPSKRACVRRTRVRRSLRCGI